MRRWALVPIAVVLVSAWWLWRADSGSSAISPVGARSVVSATGATFETLQTNFEREIERTEAQVGVQEDAAEADPVVLADGQLKTRLTVRCRLPDGSPWIAGGVELFARDRPIESGEPLVRFPHPGRAVLVSDDASGHRIRFTADDEGRVVFEAVVVGQAFQVRATDALNDVGASISCLPMTPGETRELDLWLSSVPEPVSGRCVDEQGSPLAGALVQIHPEDTDRRSRRQGTLWRTDERGEFASSPLFAQVWSLTATLEDFVGATLSNVHAGTPVELVLRKGRRLTVEVVDGFDTPVETSVLTVHAEPDGPPLAARSRFVDGAHVYEGLPLGALRLRWGGACSPQTMLVDEATERVRLRADPFGQLAVSMSELPGGLDATYSVLVLCSQNDVPAAEHKNVLNTGRQQMLWHLPAGRYRLQIHTWSATAADMLQPWGAPIEVEVRPGETTLERLGG